MNSQPDVVAITGASAGVGRATAHEFAKRGARIGLVARSETPLADVRREVEERGGSAIVVPTDVADAGQVERAAERIETELGPIDIWVNNAMTTVFSPFIEVTPEEFRRATEVTYLGFVYATMSALKRMSARRKGTIVQVGSALAYRGIPLQAAYCGAKHAVRGFTDSLRCELLHDDSPVHITMVHLPALNTPQFNWCKSNLPNHPQPVPPIYQPEVAARSIVWAAYHRRREVHVGYPTVVTIWGNKFLPGFGDRYLARNGYKSQQTDKPVDPNRPSNLFEPVEGMHATHGIFDARATDRSRQLWLTTHRGAVCLVIAFAVAAAGIAGLIAAF